MIGIDDVESIDPKIVVRVRSAFRARGGSWSRWSRVDHETFASALTAEEDALELEAQGPRKAALRVALRALRRRVEDELDCPGPQGAQAATKAKRAERPRGTPP
jgi:hypothetical protein